MGDLYFCAASNNSGIELEKSDRIDEAIRVYEANIAGDCYPACHSFDRLMVLYRKRKDFTNEIRVITKAIEIFTKENLRRAEMAIKENPSKEKAIQKALVTCENVLGSMRSLNGNLLYCFCPYDVVKYKKRLEKAVMLQNKQNK